ncbi:Polyketide_cyc domain-containing protein [Cephalotus follicularis]|uniref:Polyketide_cyc domain-containing protein n=1 Tax=Cephalotus follicularis TaxID=3775 RepID=A0A1Q3B899_CEPFO|nr:Polyketide_cyc domain-containing protein [Cephalotus follicularis]
MSGTAIAFIASPNSLNLSHLSIRNLPSCRISSLKQLSLNHLFNRIPHGSFKRSSLKPFSPPVMEWQDCTVKMVVDVPVSVAYDCYSDREAIPRWMPFISSVKIVEDKPNLSRWSLKYKAFGRDIEFSWLSQNMEPIPNRKIHWRSLEGLPNRGAVRFIPKGPSSCSVELTISYEVPQLLIPVASALEPYLESLLRHSLKQFAMVVKSYSTDSTL